MKVELVDLGKPPCEVIIGQGNFSLKTVEYLYDALYASAPGIEFGVAMVDGSGRVVRMEGNNEELLELAAKYTEMIGAGHVFVVCFRNAFPVHVLNAVKMVPTVVNIFAATSNPLKVVVAEDGGMRAVLGVMDGFTPEGREDRDSRVELLRKLGYRKD